VLGKYRAARSLPASAMATMPLIELIDTDPVGRLVAGCAQQHRWTFPAGLVVKTHQMALQLAARGLGVAVVDSLSAATFQPALRVVPIEPAGDIALRAMSLHPGPLSAAASRFIDACRKALGAECLGSIGVAPVAYPA
jgi:DNA-binding transcriptional LysR family regulator